MPFESSGSNEKPKSFEKQSPSEVRIVSFNTGFHTMNMGEENFQEAIHEFIEGGADIIFLQETGTRIGEDDKRRVKRLEEQLGPEWLVHFTGYATSFVEPKPGEKRKENGGTTVLINTDRVHLKWAKPLDLNLPMVDKIQPWEEPWSINGPDQRVAQVIEAEVGGKWYAFVNLHLDWQGGEAHKERQLAFIGQYINKLESQVDGIVVVGDTNISSPAGARKGAQYLSEGGTNFNVTIPEDPTIKLFNKIPLTPDLAFTNESVNGKISVLPNTFGSDHKPLVFDVDIAEK